MSEADEPIPETRPLSPKQRAFVEHYLQHWNSSRAAREAGYNGRSNSVGPQLLANIGIKALISERLAEKAMAADEVLARLADQARNHGAAYIEVAEGGQATLKLKDLQEAGYGHLVKGVKTTAHGQEIELYDAQAALVQIGRHHKLFTDRTEGEVRVSGFEDWSEDELHAYSLTGKRPGRPAAESPSEGGAGEEGS